jgi:hypothetical protein
MTRPQPPHRVLSPPHTINNNLGPIDTLEYPEFPIPNAQDASRMASCDIFGWVLANHEGRPPSEPIYDDAWLVDCQSSNGSEAGVGDHCLPDTASQGDGQDPDTGRTVDEPVSHADQIRRWIANVSIL